MTMGLMFHLAALVRPLPSLAFLMTDYNPQILLSKRRKTGNRARRICYQQGNQRNRATNSSFPR